MTDPIPSHAAEWSTGRICPKCRGEGQIVGVLHARDLAGHLMPLPEAWYDCDRCDGKGYLEGQS